MVFDPAESLIIDDGETKWSDIADNTKYEFQHTETKDGKEINVTLDDPPSEAGSYKLVIFEKVTEDGEEKWMITAEFPFSITEGKLPITGHSISANGDTSVHFYIEDTKENTGKIDKMVFSFSGGKPDKVVKIHDAKSVLVEDISCLEFTCDTAAKEMNDSLFAGNAQSISSAHFLRMPDMGKF